jgi:hypothetical protein
MGVSTVTQQKLRELKRLEGHHVGLALHDGSLIEDWELVSVGGGAPGTAWVWNPDGSHAFVPLTQVADFWEVPAIVR